MVAILVVLVALSLQHLVIVASIGASAFTVFIMPKSKTARPRNVIGAHDRFHERCSMLVY